MEIPKAQTAYTATREKWESVDIDTEIEEIGKKIYHSIDDGYFMTYSEPIPSILKANKLVHHLEQLGYNTGMISGPEMADPETKSRIPTFRVHANWEMMPINRRDEFSV